MDCVFTALNSCFTIHKLSLYEICAAALKVECVGLDFIFLRSWVIGIEVIHAAAYQSGSVILLYLKAKLKEEIFYSSSHFFNHFLACCEIKHTVI